MTPRDLYALADELAEVGADMKRLRVPLASVSDPGSVGIAGAAYVAWDEGFAAAIRYIRGLADGMGGTE